MGVSRIVEGPSSKALLQHGRSLLDRLFAANLMSSLIESSGSWSLPNLLLPFQPCLLSRLRFGPQISKERSQGVEAAHGWRAQSCLAMLSFMAMAHSLKPASFTGVQRHHHGTHTFRKTKNRPSSSLVRKERAQLALSSKHGFVSVLIIHPHKRRPKRVRNRQSGRGL